jgi:hypothetical protein
MERRPPHPSAATSSFRNPGSAGDEGHGHVGFYYGEDQGRLQVLGGNRASPGSTGGVKIGNFGRSFGIAGAAQLPFRRKLQEADHPAS